MKCSACVFARVEGSGLNFQAGEGEVRILGCKLHIGLLVDRYRDGLKVEQGRKAIATEEKRKNEERAAETEGIVAEDSREIGAGEGREDFREEGI